MGRHEGTELFLVGRGRSKRDRYAYRRLFVSTTSGHAAIEPQQVFGAKHEYQLTPNLDARRRVDSTPDAKHQQPARGWRTGLLLPVDCGWAHKCWTFP